MSQRSNLCCKQHSFDFFFTFYTIQINYQGVRLCSTVATYFVDILVLDGGCGQDVVVADHLGQTVLQVTDVWFNLKTSSKLVRTKIKSTKF